MFVSVREALFYIFSSFLCSPCRIALRHSGMPDSSSPLWLTQVDKYA